MTDEVAAWFRHQAADCEWVSNLNFDGWPLSVRTNSAALKRELDGYYRHFLSAAAPGHTVFAVQAPVPVMALDWVVNAPGYGKKKVKEQVGRLTGGHVVRKIQTGVHLAYLGGDRICAGPLLENPSQVINFINNVYLDSLLQQDGQLFHAAGVCIDDHGVGLAGLSGRGKSTLALHLLELGMNLVSNDRLVVCSSVAGLRMRGIPKYPRINPGTIINQAGLLPLARADDIARWRAMPAPALWQLEEKYDAPVEDCFPGCEFLLSANLEIFVLLDWRPEILAPFQLEAVSIEQVIDLLPAVMKAPGVLLPTAADRIGELNPEDYRDLLAQTRLYRLHGGVDFRGAASALWSLAAGQRGLAGE